MKKKRVQNPSLLKTVREEGCLLCGDKSDASHIKSRGSGGDDIEENLLPLCRKHHTEQHSKGWVRFCARYPAAGFALEEKGWIIDAVFGHERLIRGST